MRRASFWRGLKKQYTVRQPLEAEVLLYTGRSAVRKTLYLPGFARTTEPDDELVGEAQTEWLPLRIGRVALPACVCRTTTWERISRPLIYKEETAAAIALRACRAALLREFPDAVIETERREISTQNGKKNSRRDLCFYRKHRRNAVIRHFCVQ